MQPRAKMGTMGGGIYPRKVSAYGHKEGGQWWSEVVQGVGDLQ